MQKAILSVLLLIVTLTVHAQTQRTITGQVSDDQGEPLIGVTVTVPDQSVGTITDIDGNYSILLSATQRTLVFSYIGYETKNVEVGSSSVINVSLKDDTKLLSEVVVVGYGVQKRSDVTGAVVSIKPGDLEAMPAVNIAQALQGKLPGLNVTNTASSAEGDVKIRVRSQNSINADSEPLVVLDGIEYNGFISELNPNDIESIEILKDASSAAIYGSKAANGVILITTKKGMSGKTSVSFGATFGISKAINLPDMMDATQFYNFKQQRKGFVSAFEQEQYEKGVNTDWLKETLQTGFSQEYNLAISGGTDKTRFYVSGNASVVDGIAINDQFNRYSFRVNLDTDITSWLTYGTSTSFTYADRPGNKASISNAIKMNPLTQPYDEDGVLIFQPNRDDQNVTNPLEALNVQKEDVARGFLSNNYLQVNFPFVKGLSYKLLTGYEYRTRLIETYKSSADTMDGMKKGGDAVVNNQFRQRWSIENILNYNRDFGKHTVFLTAVYTSRESLTKFHDIKGSGFPDDYRGTYQFENAETLNASDEYTKRTSLSQMFRANYSYNSRYLFTFTVRRDGDSAFGKDNKYGIFPSVGLGWNMEQESFIQPLEWLDRSKLRLSYGKNGNQAIDAYSTMSTITEEYYLDNDGNPLTGFYANKLADPTLSWETTKQLNVGWDFSFLKGRLYGSFDAFRANTYDLLLNKVIPQINGVNSIRQNIGKTKSHGVELSLSSVNIRKKDFVWTTDFNISHNRNEIVNVGLYDEFGQPADNVANSWFIGRPINVIYAYKFDGIWQETDDILNSHMPDAKPGDVRIVDTDGDGQITPDDRQIIGHKDPNYRIGLMNTLSYKDFTFSFFITGVQGVTRYTEYMNTYFEKENIRQREWWTPQNAINTYPANRDDSNPYGLNYFGKTNDASYIRLNDISLSYRLPANICNRLGVGRLELFGNVKNVCTFTRYVGLDPEFTDDYNVPSTRSFVFGIKLGL
ncbi:MAG: TonB-dependent receptor [Tannerellaceae bacterium]|nr:TonB-dependent receptor [Tannerellaceae bacterium]